MIKFKSVSMTNFLSYGNAPTTVSLGGVGSTIIIGQNLDASHSGPTSNGAGKTSILNALVYGLYGKPISKISMENLINNINAKNMEVSVEFSIGNTQYKITRQRKTKGVGNVTLLVDSEDKTPDSVAATEREIVRIMGMPYEMFIRIVVISASHVPFLDLPVRHTSQINQSDFMEELFGITELSTKAEQLKICIADSDKRLLFKKNEITLLEQEHARYEQQITSAKKRIVSWEQDNNESIENITNKLEELNGIDVDGQYAIFKAADEAAADIKTITSTIQTLTKSKDSITLKIKKLLGELEHLKDSKCPYCLQEFKDVHEKISLLDEEIIELQQQCDDIEANIEELQLHISSTSAELCQLQKQLTVNNIQDLVDTKNASSKLIDKLNDLKQAVNPYIDPLDELLDMPLPDINYDEINSLTAELDHQKFLLKLLTKKDSFIRKALLDRNIPFLNTRLQYYLKGLGLPHKVEFTHEMTASISQFGRSLDFGNLSAGQKARVNLALSLSFRDVLQHMHQKINICVFDEVLDISLDDTGVTIAIQMLKSVAKDQDLSVYVISHRQNINHMFDNNILIRLKNGFSSIIESVT